MLQYSHLLRQLSAGARRLFQADLPHHSLAETRGVAPSPLEKRGEVKGRAKRHRRRRVHLRKEASPKAEPRDAAGAESVQWCACPLALKEATSNINEQRRG